jgi:hypothetical protein
MSAASESVAMDERVIAMSANSGSANRPMVTGTMGNPSHRYKESNVQRSVPVCGSEPIMAISRPTQAAATPRMGEEPDSTATMDRPNTEKDRSSGDPRYSMTGRRMGMETASSKAPKIPPIIDAV